MNRNPELHVHLHFHGAEAMFAQIPDEDEQLSFGTPASVESHEVPPAPVHPETRTSPEAVKPAPDNVSPSPRNVDEERRQISVTSDRNDALMTLDDKFSQYKIRKSQADRVREGIVKMPHKKFQEMEGNRRRLRGEATDSFTRACGNCTLKCAIRDNFPAWSRIHTSADVTTPRTESREGWRGRLLKDKDAHCIPPRTKKSA